MPVRHAGDEGSIPSDHTDMFRSDVRSTQTRDREGGDMPTNINDKLISWASEIDQETIRQAEKTARLPIVEGHVALMPDAHVGIGATVGSVIPTKGAVIPAAVGVDIGCGMIAAELDVTEDQLPDALEPLLGRIEHGDPRRCRPGPRPRGRATRERWLAAHTPATELADNQAKVPRSSSARSVRGTTSSSCASTSVAGCGWCCTRAAVASATSWPRCTSPRHAAWRRTSSCGSRTRISRTSSRARRSSTAYIADMLWAQEYARANRDQMMDNAMREVFAFLGFGRETQRINCHHNFTQREVHDGRELWVTRKGAIRADTGDLGVIPGSMGTRSYIVAGKGNAASWRRARTARAAGYSRTQAKKLFTTADLAEQMAGKVWLSSRADALVDEIPSAYKDIDQVMADQADLVEVLHTLHQVLNYKGT